jgi:NTE family protein
MAKEVLVADLVLEGGGVKGIGLAGAITVLENQGYSFKRIAGTSAGAIVASFVAAGISADEITRQMQTLDYKKFRDDTFLSYFGPPGKILSLLVNNGIYKGSYIKNWLEAQLDSYGVRTFSDLKLEDEEFKGMPVEKAYKLVVVTADLSKGELVYLPWDFHKYGLNPDEQSVAAAVRASISIPYFYKPAHLGADTLVDGGALSNFPIDAFDMPSSKEPRWPTFGIKLSAKPEAEQVPHKITGPLSLADALFATMMSGHDQRHLDDPCTLKRTMFVDTAKIQATNFDITRAQQDLLFTNGQKAARKFLQTWNFDSYKRSCR